MGIGKGFEVGDAGEGGAGDAVDELGDIAAPDGIGAPPREVEGGGVVAGDYGVAGANGVVGVGLPVEQDVVGVEE